MNGALAMPKQQLLATIRQAEQLKISLSRIEHNNTAAAWLADRIGLIMFNMRDHDVDFLAEKARLQKDMATAQAMPVAAADQPSVKRAQVGKKAPPSPPPPPEPHHAAIGGDSARESISPQELSTRSKFAWRVAQARSLLKGRSDLSPADLCAHLIAAGDTALKKRPPHALQAAMRALQAAQWEIAKADFIAQQTDQAEKPLEVSGGQAGDPLPSPAVEVALPAPHAMHQYSIQFRSQPDAALTIAFNGDFFQLTKTDRDVLFTIIDIIQSYEKGKEQA